MSPSPKSLVKFASEFSRIGDFFRIFGIHSFYATATLFNLSLNHAKNLWLADAADGGCGGRLDFAPMHAIRSVGQCDVNIPSLMTTGTSTTTDVDFET